MIAKDSLQKTCPVCLSTKIFHYRTIREFPIFSCIDCKLRFVIDTSTIDEISLDNFYSDAYSERYQNDYIYRDYATNENIHRIRGRRFLKIIIDLFSKKNVKNINLLDIGCSYGYFLDEARKIDIQATGVEISEVARDYAINNLKLETHYNLDKLLQQRRQFDVITMFGVLEHLPSPLEELTKIKNLLKDNGFLLITTLMRSTLVKCAYKPPEHLYYFSIESLRILFDRLGFSIEEKRRYLNYYSLKEFLFLFFNLLGLKNQLLNLILKNCPKFTICSPSNEVFLIARKE